MGRSGLYACGDCCVCHETWHRRELGARGARAWRSTRTARCLQHPRLEPREHERGAQSARRVRVTRRGDRAMLMAICRRAHRVAVVAAATATFLRAWEVRGRPSVAVHQWALLHLLTGGRWVRRRPSSPSRRSACARAPSSPFRAWPLAPVQQCRVPAEGHRVWAKRRPENGHLTALSLLELRHHCLQAPVPEIATVAGLGWRDSARH